MSDRLDPPVDWVIQVNRGFLNGIARYRSRKHFPCPVCGGRAVRALSDTRGDPDIGEFWCLDHREAFRAWLGEAPADGGAR